MSETPDDQHGGRGGGSQQGGQPQAQGGQPQGGQPQGGQPQGGQPQGGQRGGQPEGGQPQGGQYQGGHAQQPVQTGPSVGDIFSMPETMSELKLGIAVYTAIGVGLLVAMILLPLIMGFGGVAIMGILAMGSLAIAPALAGLLGLRQYDELDDVTGGQLYANTAVTGAVGTLIYGILIGLGGTIGSSLAGGTTVGGGTTGGGGAGLGALIIPLIVLTIAALVAAALAALIANKLGGSGAPQAAAGAQAQAPR